MSEAQIRNMYGCLPCPKCGSRYRDAGSVGDVRRGVYEQRCDDCGFREPWDDFIKAQMGNDDDE